MGTDLRNSYPSHENNGPRYDGVTYHIIDIPEEWPTADQSPALSSSADPQRNSSYQGTNLGVSSESDDDSDDTNNTDDESDAGIFPVSSALTKETENTTEAVSTTRGRLNRELNGPLTEALESDGNTVDDGNGTTSTSSYRTSEDDNESEVSNDSEEENDDTTSDANDQTDAPVCHPSFVHRCIPPTPVLQSSAPPRMPVREVLLDVSFGLQAILNSFRL